LRKLCGSSLDGGGHWRESRGSPAEMRESPEAPSKGLRDV
jgi:hypothetical protein